MLRLISQITILLFYMACFSVFLLNNSHIFYQTQTRMIELNSTDHLLQISYKNIGICRAGVAFNSKVPSRNFSHWNNDDILFLYGPFFLPPTCSFNTLCEIYYESVLML